MSSFTAGKTLRLIFMGTPDFACPSLKALLLNPKFSLVGVFTQPDKAVGRGQLIKPSPIKRLADKNNLPIFQPEKIRESINIIKDLQPDLIIVVAYGKIIPPEILALPTFGCVNVHASLLPKYRGAACLNAPILNGDSETGVTIMKMEAGLDTGPIIRQAKIVLTGEETLNFIHDTLADLGAKILADTLLDYVAGKIKIKIQDDSQASYVRTLIKADGRINWQNSAQEIERFIRAYNPWPGTFSSLEGTLIKILEVDKTPIKLNNYRVGELFLLNQQLAVQTGQDALIIKKLQLAGKKIMTSEEWLRGHKLASVLT